MTTSDDLAARGRKAVDALPDVVRVGPFDFAIGRLGAAEAECDRTFGLCSTIGQVIKLRENMPSPYKAVDTFFHEVGHAIYWAYGIEKGDDEERLIGIQSSACTALFRDNLWLAGWIAEALEPVRWKSTMDLIREASAHHSVTLAEDA